MLDRQTLVLMCGVVLMTVIDLSVVNVALPSIQDELGAASADLQWVVVAYGVFVAGFVMLGGRTGDLVGHRAVLIGGIGILAAASIVGGLAGSLGVLIVARAGQGLGAALAAPNALAILSRTFAEGAARNRALGILGAAGGTGAVAGVVLGGLLVQGPGWRWAFLLNVPVGIVLIALVATRVPAHPPDGRRERADIGGALLLTAGLMAASFGVHQSVGAGWLSAETLVPLLAGLALLGGFLAHEGRVAMPLIPLATLRKRSLLFANLAGGLLWASFLGLIYHATLFVQQVLHYSPLAAGASTIPIAVLSLVISARLAPRVIARLGAARALAVGMAVQGAGLLLLARLPENAVFVVDLLPAYAVVGLGLGLAQVAVQVAALAGMARNESGLAGGALETAREMGGALGLAVLVSIALGAGTTPTDAFQRSILGAASFAAASALVAIALLWPTERRSRVTIPMKEAKCNP